ncbi:glucosaminidase domain-containing protein [Robertkochia solimangrovi]|uniref:glucosaminidase domain-containing protein n=1 Tax=Robertkochia solimangrovi TaxID=2213046 RepID=UPI00117D6188|nr:glucosaminidase domain-containing protein [Robertkochia solimangrovi]TRZ43093.1 N-acetylmuramidase [Robertkochia solimangrovi]
MKLNRLILIVVLLTLVGCGSHRKSKKSRTYRRPPVKKETVKQDTQDKNTDTFESTSKTTVYTDVVEQYIADFDDIAMRNMRDYGIPSSIILAQGILESGAGRGNLVKRANNHFGIKCHQGWEGEKVYHDDDEDDECFRKYEHPEQSYMDHSLFLTGRKRYASLFELKKNDYKGWAKGLRAAGYATDPKYPQKLISIIEKYKLYRFDAEVLGDRFVEVTESRDGLYHIVQKGDTLYSLSKRYNVSVDEIKRINKLKDNNIAIGQELYFN